MHITINSGQTERTLRLIKSLFASAGITVILLMLASCAGQQIQEDHWDPLQSPAVTGGAESTELGLTRDNPQLAPAMADLLGRADQAIEQRQWSVATGMLERALRINPKQAEAWTRMALVKLGENNPEQGMHMAKKSNRYARTNKKLMAYNWLLIARAQEQLGSTQDAAQARLRSRQLQEGTE